MRAEVDAAASEVTAVLRPALGAPRLEVTASGEVVVDEAAVADLDHQPTRTLLDGELGGTLRVALDDQPAVGIDLAHALVEGVAELSRGRDHELVLRGRRAAPAGEFGIAGPPLVNPTVVVSWRLVLAPEES